MQSPCPLYEKPSSAAKLLDIKSMIFWVYGNCSINGISDKQISLKILKKGLSS